MEFQLVWTKRAIDGYSNIVNYLEEEWTDREVRNFVKQSEDFFEILCHYPEIFQKTSNHKNVYRGPMNKLTIITYRIKPRKNQIEIINIRGAKQKPRV